MPTRSAADSVRDGRMCSSASRAAIETPAGVAITRYIQLWTRSSMGQSSRSILRRLQRLGVHGGEVGDVGVPFEQRGGVAEALERVGVEIPHLVDHAAVVRIDDVRAVI